MIIRCGRNGKKKKAKSELKGFGCRTRMKGSTRMKLAVMTWYHYRNYGTALQAAALTSVLRELGHEPELIRYTPCGYFRTIPDYHVSALLKRAYRKIRRRGSGMAGGHFCDEQKDRLFQAFLEERITFTDTCRTKADMERLNDRFDAFICGSDQIWSPLNFDPKYYLDFVHEPAKKIAYAPSMGVEKIEDRYVKREIKKHLKQFGALSVRERAGQSLIRELSGRMAPVVLDPTLLYTAQQWTKQLALRPSEAEPYLLVYMLGKNAEHWAAAEETAKHLGLKLRLIPVYKDDFSRDGCITEPIGPQEFVQQIYGAAYVCTDSFHGLCFSLLFHKAFTAFARFQKGDKQNQNSRVTQLLRMAEMTERMMKGENWSRIAEKTPDFSCADAALKEMREKSMQYLTAALKVAEGAMEKCTSVTQQNSLCCGCGACKCVCPVGAIQIAKNQNGFWEAVVDETLCIHCGKCKAVCPFCAEASGKTVENAALFSFKCSDSAVLERSTSGGAAYSIARMLLKQGYAVVGCQYNGALKRAEHIIVRDETQLSALQGSKYIQSDFAAALETVKTDANPAVVFGTPCQIAAERSVLAGRENVIYIDLVCHGVPSDHLFCKYQEHIHEESSVNLDRMTMDFRYKPKGWADIHLHATDGEHEYCCEKQKDPFFRMFEHGVCYSEACYECRWRGSSCADIRLGDYWGPKFQTDQTGVSMVLCFTQRGRALMEQLHSAGKGSLTEQPIEDYLNYQQKNNLPKPVFYDAVLDSLRNETICLADIADKYVIPLENRRLSRMEYWKYVCKMISYAEK